MRTSIALTGFRGLKGARIGMFEQVFPHDKGSEAICESIYAESWLSSTIRVRPDNVKATIDERSDNAMQSRVDQSQICQVIGMGDLKFN